MTRDNLIRRAQSRVRNALGAPPPLVECVVFDQRLLVRAGTFRDEPDYDDAWRLACALRARVVFDIGANVGQAALGELVSERLQTLVLVEANPEALAIAADNLIRNHLSERVRFVCAFAGDVDDDTVTFWTVGSGQAGSMYRGHAHAAAKIGSSRQVPTVTVDSLCARYDVVPDLVKIDVEGAEGKVLAGSKTCAVQHSTRFLVEMHSNPDLTMLDNASGVLTWCRTHGYRAWYLSQGVELKVPEQIEKRGRCHLLLQPADWPYPQWLRNIEQSADLTVAWESRHA